MKFYVYAIYNKLLDCFERPIVTNYTQEDFIEAAKRDYVASLPEARSKMHENLIYFVGTYDDHDAKFDLLELKNPIFDLGSLEVKKDGEY